MALSQDGVKLRKGMRVVEIWTRDAGKTWHLSASEIVGVRRINRRLVAFKTSRTPPYCWNTGIGESRVWVDPLKAVAEIRRRNKLASKKK